MTPLPPDLERLGDVLAAAAARRLAARRRRRVLAGRLASTALAGALALAALAPTPLSPADGVGRFLLVAPADEVAAVRPACDQPRGDRFTVPPGCQDVAATDLGGKVGALVRRG